jgi:hypothetical protein
MYVKFFKNRINDNIMILRKFYIFKNIINKNENKI